MEHSASGCLFPTFRDWWSWVRARRLPRVQISVRLPRMRLPHVRFTVRQVMVAVAVVGVALGVTQNVRQWQFYRRMAAVHFEIERGCLEEADCVEQTGEYINGCLGYLERDPKERRRRARSFREWSRYHGLLRAKYEQASHYPWKLVGPDPAPPEP